MKMNQKGRGNDNFQTPPHIFEQLDNIFKFTQDVACTSENFKIFSVYGRYFDCGWNGLENGWQHQRCFCNPPFSNKADWIKKSRS